jgi:class 3 adenylate cyclase
MLTRQHLRDYLLNTDERAVYHAYPRSVADHLRSGYRETLEVLSDALLNGDVTLHWEAQCPACSAIGEFARSLNEAPRDGVTCAACGNHFHPHIDIEVHVTFSVHPALRQLSPAANDLDFRARAIGQYAPTSGHEMLTVQSFRDWAQAQPLPSGHSLEVQRVALLFTDLSGSTALYQRRGDPRAYSLVREHFDILFRTVDRSGGAVVKTIGDSIMAVFNTGKAAMQAALACHRAIQSYNRDQGLDPGDWLLLKAGLHCGPSILVTLNDRLDYFGQTVNIAARVEGLAQGGEVAFSQDLYVDPGVMEMVAEYTVETIITNVKGLDRPVTVYRIAVVRSEG